MDRLYDINSASRGYREEALEEARKRHLVEQARGDKAPRFRLRGVVSAMSAALSVLRG